MTECKNVASVIKFTIKKSALLSAATLSIIIVAVISALIPPLILEDIVDSLANGNPIDLITALIYFMFLVIAGISESLQNVFITVVGQKITKNTRKAMCNKLSRLPSYYYVENETGRVSSKFINDVNALDSLFTNGIIDMFADAAKIISIIFVIFAKSPGLGIIMLILIPFIFLMTRIFQKNMLSAQISNRRAIEKVNNHVPETIKNIRMIRMLSKQKYMEKQYDEYIQESYRAMDTSNLYDSLYSPIINIISSVVIAILMIFSSTGTCFSAFFGISVGSAVAIIAYVGKIFSPIESIGMEIQNIQSAVAAVKRIDEFLREEEKVNEKIAAAPELLESTQSLTASDTTSYNITFDNVTFSYDKKRDVIKDFSLIIDEGSTVTLTGRTGAGKSTLFRLLLGLYKPDRGNVFIGNRNVLNIPDSEKRKLYGYVQQQFSRVDGSIAQQITLFDDTFSREDVIEVCKMVGLHHKISGLENGYDTHIGDAKLSQGEYQLLSIARAIIAKPKILLLDEITADLDGETEQRVLDAAFMAVQGRTVISISHRLNERVKGTVVNI
ncbi:MAG: ABC transporter ATP-binding protein [Eubacteriales bacterium]|nr:ABC transporter ATP-binding protein [Eubacteriales bacterium]